MTSSQIDYAENAQLRTYAIEKDLSDTVVTDDKIRTRVISALLFNRWTIGCLSSFVFIWILSALLCNSAEPYIYDEATKSWVIEPGSRIAWKGEGSGKSYFGKFGLGFFPDISRETSNIIMLWGDSFVEAFQVDDDKKMAQQLTQLLKKDGQNLICASRAMGGDNIADHILNIPQYEKIIPSISRHIIVINGSDDILPDQANDTRGMFLSAKGYELIESDEHCHSAYFKTFINEYRLYFILPILHRFTQGISLRFSPGPVQAKSAFSDPPMSQDNDKTKLYNRLTWEFLVKEIRESTKKDVTIIYVPHVPRIENNRILYDDTDWTVVKDFAECCRAAGIDFINMHDAFVNNYKNKGEFPKGFPNSRLADGHLNITGHRLIAETIFHYLKEKEQ